MVSRDTVAHVGAVLLALVVLLVAVFFDVGQGSTTGTAALFVLVYGLVLGGGHLYLAVRGEDGMVPVEARWRYVAMLAVLIGAGAVATFGGDRSIATIEVRSIAYAAIVATTAGYVLIESVAGYRASRSE